MASYHKYKPVNLLPFDIHNRGEFIGGLSQPTYHPASMEYERYWYGEASKCIKGHWGWDFETLHGKELGGWRWCPGNLYFFANYGKIVQQGEGNTRSILTPDLRDTEWVLFYDLTVCDGFSGFSKDGKYSCFDPLRKKELGLPLSYWEKEQLETKAEHYMLLKKDGTYKQYKDPRFLLYATYKDPVGDPLYFNTAQNYLVLSTRRGGKTGGMSNGIVTYDFTFNGARTLDDYIYENTTTTVVVGSADSSKTKEFFEFFTETYEYLRTGVGAYDDGVDIVNGVFWKPTTGGIAKENERISNRVKLEGNAGYAGPGSRVVHVSYQKDASKGAGYGARRIVVEEVGLSNMFEDIHRENDATQKADSKYGYTVYIGTGGDMQKIEGIKKAFWNPKAYTILPCPDIFNNTGKDIARFIPSYYVKNQYRNENGMQDIQKAFHDEMMERDQKREDGGDAYIGHMISFPFMPQEMFLQIDGNRFPADRLEARSLYLLNNPIKYSTGKLYYTDKMNTKVRWEEDLSGDCTPFFSVKEYEEARNKEGAVVIYEHPVSYRPIPAIYEDAMYILHVDPVLNDTGSSQMHAWVEKRYDFVDPDAVKNGMVAEWFGRFDKTEENYEQVFKMAYLYDAKIFPEMNVGQIVSHARMTKRLSILQPSIGDIPGVPIQTKKNYEYGLYIAPQSIEHYEKVLDDRLREVVSYKETLKKDKFEREEIWYVDTIPSKLVIEQLIFYSRSGNFDAVSSQMLGAAFNKGTAKISEQYRDSEQDRQTIHAINQLIARNTTTMLRR